MRPGDPTIEVDVKVMHKSAKALLVAIQDCDYKGKPDEWIPLSQIAEDSEINRESDVGDEGTLIMSKWIAEQKGWC